MVFAMVRCVVWCGVVCCGVVWCGWGWGGVRWVGVRWVGPGWGLGRRQAKEAEQICEVKEGKRKGSQPWPRGTLGGTWTAKDKEAAEPGGTR